MVTKKAGWFLLLSFIHIIVFSGCMEARSDSAATTEKVNEEEEEDDWPWDDEDDDEDDITEGFHPVQSMELVNEERSSSHFRKRPKQPKCKIIGTSIICKGKVGKNRRKYFEKQLEYGRGPSGLPGPPGMRGMPGPKGKKGERGFPGRPGSKGKEGPIGPPGPQGDKGPEGIKGDKGDQGIIGAQGFPGIPGNCRMLTFGTNDQNSCPMGSRGPDGIKGSMGQEGVIGPQGGEGNQGEIGAPGQRGSPGPPGTIGPHGSLQVNGPCLEKFSDWVIPNRSPMSLLKTNCSIKEFLQSIHVVSKGPRIRYQYSCCPFLAESLDRFMLPIPP